MNETTTVSRIMPAGCGAGGGAIAASASTSTTAAPSPLELVKALTRRGPELHDVEVLHMATMGIADYSLPEYEGHFRHNALFIGGNVRKAVQEGRADYTPIFLSEIEGLFTLRRPAHRRVPAAMHAARSLRLHEPGAERRRVRSPRRSAPAT